ncbi:adenylyltransferase/cytidyltransferase family protein [Methanothrix sp.]|uniref:adenylyltransferase/cytidyltransferase family protein n=1 Tax=Methanothrix sp. TaxID=90426 RepID=UPI001BD2BEFC
MKIGLVSGSFDLIHLGHVRLINTAKSLCDVLVVATMSTSSIRKQDKNVHGDRPIYSQEDRVTVLSALRSTDHIVIFDELDCKEVIRSLKPDIYFKHQKDMERTVVREECGLVRTLGGKVIITTESAGYSSTDIINHMRGLAGK